MRNSGTHRIIRLALPKGRFLTPTATLLAKAGLGFHTYGEKARQYRLWSDSFPNLFAKVLQEKDIPIQVGVGNYDLGICGSDWVEEFTVRYRAGTLVKVCELGYGEGNLYVVAASSEGELLDLDELCASHKDCRIVTEYPNLAETFAMNIRMKKFRIFPIWGAAEVYPPESAELAILWSRNEANLESEGLVCLKRLLPVTMFLIANRESLQSKDLSPILNAIASHLPQIGREKNQNTERLFSSPPERVSRSYWNSRTVRLALPDGHQQEPTSQFLRSAGLDVQGYSAKALNRRPLSDVEWLGIKVIRPQDMPLQVANGNFDLAITGEDWLLDQSYRFPSMPVRELFPLGFGMVRVVAAVSQDMPASSIEQFKSLIDKGQLVSVRVASEYINIADKYLRDNHISPYKLIPTWGASEAFLPEDADMLIDNTQTGETLKQHQLKIIDILFQSTACLIANENSLQLPEKKEKIEYLCDKLYAAVRQKVH
jgi:ATP phosphoribosyltransferase